MSNLLLAVNQTKTVNRKIVQRSTSPSEIQKLVSREINKSFNENFPSELKEIGFHRVNFDADKRGRSIVINKAYLIHINGEVTILPYKNKITMRGNSIIKKIREKVLNSAMSVHIPAPLLLFHEEVVSTFRDGLILKLGIATILGSFFAGLGLSPENLFVGIGLFLMIAMLEAILGIMPNTRTEKDNIKEHTLNAKFLKFVVNLVAMAGLLGIHLFASLFIPNPSMIEFLPVNIHYFGIAYFLGSYGYNIFRYAAIANNSKNPLPEAITRLFNKEKDEE